VDMIIPASIAPSNTIGHSAVFGITMMSVSPGCRPARCRDDANRRHSWLDSRTCSYDQLSHIPSHVKVELGEKKLGNIRHWLYDQASAYMLTHIFMPSAEPPIDTLLRFSHEFPLPNYVYEFIYIEPFPLY
jgi:hypothetical protein